MFLIGFSCFILLFLFFMQILFLNNYYEIYKTKEINSIMQEISEEENVTDEYLQELAFEKGICVSKYKDDTLTVISNEFNRGCLSGDPRVNQNYITKNIKLNKQQNTFIIENMRFKNKTLVAAIKLGDGVYIFINASLEPLDSSIKLLKSQFLYISIIIFVLSLVCGYYISKQISEPIESINKNANEMGKGNYNISFSTSSSISEIRELSKTLENAKEELAKTEELRKDLMANVGHDLKTPLTMIKAYAEMTKDFPDNQEKRDSNMNIIIEETDRLTTLVNDILDLSKLQAEGQVLKLEEFDLDEVIKKIINRYDILIKNEKYKFVYENKEPIIINADIKRIEQVIYNLINNAINYTGKDKKIIISVEKKPNEYCVKITDTGKGIKKDDLVHIWDKYYHNEKKHQRNAIGTGLGLSIVKNALESHGYKYGVDTTEGKGTTFYFIIK